MRQIESDVSLDFIRDVGCYATCFMPINAAEAKIVSSRSVDVIVT